MADLDWVSIGLAAYVGVGLFLSLYLVPFKIVPRAWAKAVRTKGHPAQLALDHVLEEAAPKVAAAVKVPDPAKFEALVTQFNGIVPLMNNLTGDNLVAAMKQAYSDMRKGEIARGDLPAGDLTANQQKELEDLRRDPDGKVALVAAENAIDAAVGAKLLKESTGKALKKQLTAAFSAGQPVEAILAPYRALLERFLGGGTPSAGSGVRAGGPV